MVTIDAVRIGCSNGELNLTKLKQCFGRFLKLTTRLILLQNETSVTAFSVSIHSAAKAPTFWMYTSQYCFLQNISTPKYLLVHFVRRD